MNIIEALQALKDGKKIRLGNWEEGHFLYIDNIDPFRRITERFEEKSNRFFCSIISMSVSEWELYPEPIPLTSEERKALELAKACGFDTLRRNRYDDNGICVCVKNECDRYWYTEYAPSLSCLNDVSWMPEKGDLPIDDLLNGGEKRK